MAATRSSTKIWHAALLFVFLLVYGRTWCDLSRGRASHTARLARRAPPQPAKQGGRLQPRPKARHARGQLRPPLQHLQLKRPVPLLGVIREISNNEMLVQLYWQAEGEQRLSPITGILKQVPGASRLQQGDKVHVHVLPMGERLMLRLAVEPGCKGGLGFYCQSPSSKKAWSQDPDSLMKWSPKLERLDSVNWMDAEPLPHGLCGTAAQHLQGQVVHVDPARATLRLFWEAPPGPGLETQNPELSPIAAQLSAEVLQAFFNLTAVPLCSDYLKEGQLLSVQLKASSSPDMSVGLSPLQPIPPRPSPPCAGWAAPKIWQRWCSHTVPCRVTAATEAAWRRTPVDTATEMEKKFGSPNHWKLHTTSSLATTAFAVSATKQDMVITGAMPRAERLSLLALLIAQHLSEAAPHERVLLLGPYANVRLQSLQRSKDELVREHLKKVRAQTLAGSLHEVLQMFTRKGRREDARSVSLVVVEGLPSDAKEQEALKQLLSLMPSQRRWGPTILWHREPAVGPTLQVIEAALTASPARLQTANALHGAHEQLKLVPESLAAAAQVIAQHLVQRRSIAIFTDRKQNFLTEMQKLVPDELLQQARLHIVSAADEWGKSDRGIFDIMIHVDPPPKPSEYFLRLASCRQLALVLMDVRKDHGEERLDNHWVEFANYAQDFVRGPDSWRLRHLCRHEHHGKTRLSQDFQKDFQASKKELVWTAGVAETDTGLIFDAGL